MKIDFRRILTCNEVHILKRVSNCC